MSEFEHDDLPHELRGIAKRLRDERHVASPVELDRIKTRTMKRAAAPRAARGGGLMRKRTFVTALIMVGAIGTGSAAALSIGGVSIPSPTVLFSAKTLFPSKRPARAPVAPASAPAPSAAQSAAASVYGTRGTTITVVCVSEEEPAQCTAYVMGQRGTPTGTVTFTSNKPGSFRPVTCTLVELVPGTATCSTSYIPAVDGVHFITGHYSGDATYAPNTSVLFGTVLA